MAAEDDPRRFCAVDRAISRLSRRDLIRLVGRAAAAALAGVPASTLMAQPRRFGSYPFALGVASGDPLPAGIVLWTRLAPKPLDGGGMPAANVEVAWEVADDEQFRRVVRRGRVVARPELAHSVHVDVGGLRPGREYFYRFHAGTEASSTGRTRTAPAPGAQVDSLRYAVCGCSHYEAGYFTAFAHLADEAFDFVVHTGDYIYEAPYEWGQVRTHRRGEAFTLDDYRLRYAEYKMDADLQAAHRSAPFILSWDDHEVADNYANDHDEFDTPATRFLLRRAAAYQAYYEAMPLRASSLPDGPHLRLYRRLSFGRLIDLHVLDTRQYRTDQPCGDGNRTECPEAAQPQRTMLGHVQERWLSSNLAASSGVWTILSQQSPMFTLDAASLRPDGRFSMDKWDGYTAARRRLYARLLEARTPNPVVLSGDTHVHYASELTLDPLDRRSTPVGVELTNSSISSSGDGSEVQNGWSALQRDNPQVKFHNNRRGYIACVATPRALRADFRVVDRVTSPGAPLRTAGSVIVEAGRPGLQSA